MATEGSMVSHGGKMVLLVVLIILGTSVALFVMIGLWQTYRVEHGEYQQTFISGTVGTLPDGFYHGSTHLGKRAASWQGKVFDANQTTGINRFDSGERYVFKIYPTAGMHDRHTQVLRIDYNQPGNPWWLHLIVDEIVETTPNHYLGKVHLKVFPGLSFTLTYFELAR